MKDDRAPALDGDARASAAARVFSTVGQFCIDK